MTKTAAIAALTAVVGFAAAANAQLTLGAGEIKFRIVADNTVIDINDAGDRTINMMLQVRYDGGNANAGSLAQFRGRISSNEDLTDGVLDRTLLQSPFQGSGSGFATRRGVADPHRDLFTGGSNNNDAASNGGAPVAGEFIGANGLAGFGNIGGTDLGFGPVGRAQGTAALDNVSVGLHDTILEGDPAADFARWDSVFFMTYVVTDLQVRTITFDWQARGSAANPGVSEDCMLYRSGSNWLQSNVAVSEVVEGAVIQVVPTPGSAALLGLGGVLAARRRRIA